MELNDILKILKRKWQTIAFIVAVIAGLAFVATLAQPAKYRSTVRVLVVQNFKQDVDPYSIFKSIELINGIFSEVIYSQTFLDQVVTNGNGLVDDYSQNSVERRKEWKKTVRTRILPDTGILNIDVYKTSYEQSRLYAEAIANVLVNDNRQYHGGGKQIQVNIIDQPFTTDTPASPNVLLNTFIAAIVGVMVGGSLVYLFPQFEVNFLDKIETSPQDNDDSDYDQDGMYEVPQNLPFATGESIAMNEVEPEPVVSNALQDETDSYFDTHASENTSTRFIDVPNVGPREVEDINTSSLPTLKQHMGIE